MLQIHCPYCGLRDETEFTFGGQAHIVRPTNPSVVSDREWVEYLYIRDNPKGLHLERWQHRFGCRQWFNVVRDTATHQIHASYSMGEPRPSLEQFCPADTQPLVPSKKVDEVSHEQA